MYFKSFILSVIYWYYKTGECLYEFLYFQNKVKHAHALNTVNTEDGDGHFTKIKNM